MIVGIVSSSGLAVLRLMTNWIFVGCLTGKSPSFAPQLIGSSASSMGRVGRWRAGLSLLRLFVCLAKNDAQSFYPNLITRDGVMQPVLDK